MWARKGATPYNNQLKVSSSEGEINACMVYMYMYVQGAGCRVQGVGCRAVINRVGGRGGPSATMNVVPGYFHWKIEEKQNQKKSLAV